MSSIIDADVAAARARGVSRTRVETITTLRCDDEAR
jgi:hypothetical protein